MQPPKGAIKTVLGTGGVIGIGTVITMLWNAIDNVEARATAMHDKGMAQVRAEIALPIDMMAREVCLIRYRLDVQAGVPNPGGCGK